MKITAHWQTRVEKGPDVMVPVAVSMGTVSVKGLINAAKVKRIISNAQKIAMDGNVVRVIFDIQPEPSTQPETEL